MPIRIRRWLSQFADANQVRARHRAEQQAQEAREILHRAVQTMRLVDGLLAHGRDVDLRMAKSSVRVFIVRYQGGGK